MARVNEITNQVIVGYTFVFLKFQSCEDQQFVSCKSII